jgi:large subunit ribosomal protein L1
VQVGEIAADCTGTLSHASGQVFSPNHPTNESRDPMGKKSKRYRAALSKQPQNLLPLAQAVEVLKQYDSTKFDQTVEVHMRLGVDPNQADQIIRGSLVLPNGIGKTQRVVVFAKGDAAKAAEAAGADEVGQEDLAKKIKDGWTDFDVCIAAPDMMGLVGPLGRVLGPRGLMPSPRAGTVTADVAKVVGEYKAGKVEFRNDKGGNVHSVVGKMSFDSEKLIENINAFVSFIESLKPSTVKGTYVRGVAICSTMSPSVRIAS